MVTVRRTEPERDHRISPWIATGGQLREHTTRVELNEGADQGTCLTKNARIRVRIGNHADQAGRIQVSRLELHGTQLRLKVREAGDDLDRDPMIPADEQEIGGPVVARSRDRSLGLNRVAMRHAPHDLGDVARLRNVAQRGACGIEANPHAQPDGGGMRRERTRRHAARPTELASRNL